jgi:hypothetical protein
MLKILYEDGIEEELEGKVKFYEGNQPANCSFEVIIDGREKNDFSYLKLVYDDKTKESIYFSYMSYGFHKGYDKYQELYEQSIRELKLLSQFRILVDEYGEHISLENLAEWLVFNENGIKEIYN